ncbi:MAG: PKD domain-containing protein, partial [Candidatus Heimdallarchaeota archaeon]
DGSTTHGVKVKRTYDKPGSYSEVLKVTDDDGHVDYDFAIVQVLDPAYPDRLPRFGLDYLRHYFRSHGTAIEILNS